MGHHPLSERFDELLALITYAVTGVACPARRRAIKQLLAS